MDSLATVSFSLGVIAYSVASTYFFFGLAGRPAPGGSGAASWVLVVAAAFHLAHIIAASLLSQICPVESIHFALSLSALVLVAIFSWARRSRNLDALGVVVGPLALTFLVAAQFIRPTESDAGLSRSLLAMHVSANLVGFALVLLAGAAAAFYLFTSRQLKAKRLGAIGRLPSLEALDLTSQRFLLFAFPLLSFGVVTGGMFFSELEAANGASLLRAGLGYATWGLVAAVLVARSLFGWRGRRSAWGTLAGVVTVLLVVVVYILRPLLGGAA